MNDFDEDIDDLETKSNPKMGHGIGRIRMAFTRWWIILIFAILGYLAALYTLSIAEPSHTAKAVLEVITMHRELVGKELERDRLAIDKSLVTIAHKIVAVSQLKKVVNHPNIQAIEKAVPPKFSLKPKYWRTEEEMRFKSADEVDMGEIVGMISGNVKVTPKFGTTLIDISVTHKDAIAAVTIADTIMEAYLETEAERKKAGISDANNILLTEANEVDRELETARSSYAIYKTVMNTSAQLAEKRHELILLKQRYKYKHPKMIEAKALHDEIKERFRRDINLVLESPSEIEFWSQHIDQMKKYDRIIKEGLENSEEKSDEVEEAEENWLAIVQTALSSRASVLNEYIERKQAFYDSITKRNTDIGVNEKNKDSQVKIAEPAFSRNNAVVDKYKRLGQGIAGGALVGFAIAYLLGMIDYKIYDVRTVEDATGLPCLSAIPDGAAFDLEDEWENVLTAEPNTANAEAIRNLRASVMLLGKAERHKVLLITSAAPGEGKTTVASELAASFALNEQKTILIDLDLRKPRVHTLFPRLSREPGMADVLAGQADLAQVVQKTKVDGLHVILAGSKAPSPSELLHDRELESVITKLSDYYDRIIIDTPPVLPVSDTRLLVNHAQSVILVVRALKIPVGAIMRARELLEKANAPLAGVVINAIKQKHSGGSYYGYKGYGEYGGSGGYGGYYEDEK